MFRERVVEEDDGAETAEEEYTRGDEKETCFFRKVPNFMLGEEEEEDEGKNRLYEEELEIGRKKEAEAVRASMVKAFCFVSSTLFFGLLSLFKPIIEFKPITELKPN